MANDKPPQFSNWVLERNSHMLCNVQALIRNGLLWMGKQVDEPEESFTAEQRTLLQMVPGLEECLIEGSDDEAVMVAELGVLSAILDDTKSLKGAILDWIVPLGHSFHPLLAQNVKMDCGFHHEHTGALLCPTSMDWLDIETKEKLRSGEMLIPGDQWPIFLYSNCKFDPEEPWNGLLRSSILVSFGG
ncbi:hypothetical protein PILCRDRAFT_89794 [Piloderma croceum F 1598]|uniref:Uncharacterized protein n=1 Tax=Piloderma croceum (strain F 1598) TaxID=765440 RepID=A0A0C3FK14_PILCF|nr:hypothetical protein PILCRDRAFT_89794 [Piloderma croceum F 1598]